jgi:hypothetical protein
VGTEAERDGAGGGDQEQMSKAMELLDGLIIGVYLNPRKVVIPFETPWDAKRHGS